MANKRVRKITGWALAAWVCSVSSGALAAPFGRVLLDDGRTIEGELTEVKPGSHIAVRLADGSTSWMPWARVTEVQESPDGAQPPTAPSEVPQGSAAAPAQYGAERQRSQAIEPGGEARLHFVSDRPGTVINEIDSHTSSIAVVRGRAAALNGATWRALCEAPCEVRVPHGYREFIITADGAPSVTRSLTVRGEALQMRAKMGSTSGLSQGMMLGILGLTSTLMGAAFLPVGYMLDRDGFTTAGWAMLIGGGAAAAGGIVWASQSSSEVEVSEARARQARSAPIQAPMLRWSGTF